MHITKIKGGARRLYELLTWYNEIYSNRTVSNRLTRMQIVGGISAIITCEQIYSGK